MRKSLNIAILFAILPTNFGSAEVLPVLHELRRIQGELHRVRQHQEQNSGHLSNHQRLAQEALIRALGNSFTTDSHAVVRDLEYFFAADQQSIPLQYIKAHGYIAGAYQKLKLPHLAHKHFLFQLDALLSHADSTQEQIIQALQGAVDLEIWSGVSMTESVESYIPRIKSRLAADPAANNTLAYIFGKLYMGKDELDIGQEYLQVEVAKDAKPAVRGKALYLSGILWAKRGEYEVAEQFLSRAIESGDPKDFDLFRLGLARLYGIQKKPALAAVIYEQVADEAEVKATALFERTQALIQSENLAEAEKSARTLMAKYPNSTEAKRVERMLGYILLQDGRLQEARTLIASNSQKLNGLKQWLEESFRGEITADHILAWQEMISDLPASPLYREALQAASLIQQTRFKLQNAKGEMSRLLMHKVRVGLDNANPYWMAQSENLEALEFKIVAQGIALAKIETAELEPKFSESERARVRGLVQIVESLYVERTPLQQMSQGWRNQFNYLMLLAQVSETQSDLMTFRAKMAPFRADPALKGNPVLLQRANEAAAALEHAFIDLNNLNPGLQAEVSKPSYSSWRFVQAGLLLDEMDSMLSAYRAKDLNSYGLNYQQDLQDAWQAWRKTSQAMLMAQKGLVADFSKALKDSQNRGSNLHEQLMARERDLQRMSQNLSKVLSQYVRELAGHYQQRVSELVSVNQRWLGDAEWYEFHQVKSRGEQEGDRYRAKKEDILNELRQLALENSW